MAGEPRRVVAKVEVQDRVTFANDPSLMLTQLLPSSTVAAC